MSLPLPKGKLTLAALGRHAKYGALYGTGATGTAVVETKRRDKGDAAALLGGAALGQGVYQGAGYHAARSNDAKARVERKRLAAHGFSGAKQDRRADRHFADHGLSRKEHTHRAGRAYTDMFRTYPLELPGAKVKRTLAWTHGGKTGTALGAAVTATGALTAEQAHRRVGKSVTYGYRERTLSVPRTTEALAGGALAAYGVSRMRLGGMASYGARLAGKHGGGKEADEALALARELRDSVRRQTGKGEKQLRKVAALDRAIERVPANLRPAVATSVGAVLVSNARPVHNERFRPL